MLPSLRARAQRSLEYIRLHNDFVACVDQFAPLHEVHSVDEVSIELSPTDHPVQFMDNLPETVDAVLGERASGPGAFAEPTSPHACQKGLVTSDRHIPMSASRWSLRVPSSRRVACGVADRERGDARAHAPGAAIHNRWNVDTGAGKGRRQRLTLLLVNAPQMQVWTFDVDER